MRSRNDGIETPSASAYAGSASDAVKTYSVFSASKSGQLHVTATVTTVPSCSAASSAVGRTASICSSAGFSGSVPDDGSSGAKAAIRPADGLGDALADGSGDALADGSGDALADGSGDVLAEGAADALAEGAADAVADGSAEDVCVGAGDGVGALVGVGTASSFDGGAGVAVAGAAVGSALTGSGSD